MDNDSSVELFTIIKSLFFIFIRQSKIKRVAVWTFSSYFSIQVFYRLRIPFVLRIVEIFVSWVFWLSVIFLVWCMTINRYYCFRSLSYLCYRRIYQVSSLISISFSFLASFIIFCNFGGYRYCLIILQFEVDLEFFWCRLSYESYGCLLGFSMIFFVQC